MKSHLSDRSLDSLLNGTLDESEELAIEEHARRCERCAHQLREWELLFPQIRSVIPTGEHAVAVEPVVVPGAAAVQNQVAFTPTARPSSLNVFVPDWTPPEVHRSWPTKAAWGIVTLLGLTAGYLLFWDRAEKAAPELAGYYSSDPATPTSDSAGLGSGVGKPAEQPVTSSEILVSAPQITPASTQTPPATQEPIRPETSDPVPVERAEPEPETREPAQSFPIAADPRSTGVPSRPATRQPVTGGNPEAATAAQQPPAPLPPQFQRVSLGEAMSQLSGTVRLIGGLTPTTVEVAQGSALPGADPSRAVVRVVYNAPEGRLILDQQRLNRGGGREPEIAISTSPNGVSVAQWVDRGGFWISLAGRIDQKTLLSVANRIQ